MFFHPSLRCVQLPLDHLVEKRDRAVCHQHRNGRRSHVPVWWTQWCSVCGEEEGSKNRSLGNPSDQLMRFGYPPPTPPWKTNQWERIQTSEVESQWCPVMGGWTGGSDDWHFEGTANVHCYTSCTLTTLYYSKVSFIQCCHMKRYN